MKSPFGGIAETLKPKMEDFKVFLLNQAETFENGVRAAARAAISPNGKYIRPMLVFASAPADADEKSLVRRATIAELVHLSTLIHDDVIDRADMRRNSETAYKKYGAKTAILLGDAIFSHMMSLAFEENSMAVLKKTADCVRTVCEGEIKQTLADRARLSRAKNTTKSPTGRPPRSSSLRATSARPRERRPTAGARPRKTRANSSASPTRFTTTFATGSCRNATRAKRSAQT